MTQFGNDRIEEFEPETRRLNVKVHFSLKLLIRHSSERKVEWNGSVHEELGRHHCAIRPGIQLSEYAQKPVRIGTSHDNLPEFLSLKFDSRRVDFGGELRFFKAPLEGRSGVDLTTQRR